MHLVEVEQVEYYHRATYTRPLERGNKIILNRWGWGVRMIYYSFTSWRSRRNLALITSYLCNIRELLCSVDPLAQCDQLVITSSVTISRGRMYSLRYLYGG